MNGGRVRKSKTAADVVTGTMEGKPEWFCKGVEAAQLVSQTEKNIYALVRAGEEAHANARQPGIARHHTAHK